MLGCIFQELQDQNDALQDEILEMKNPDEQQKITPTVAQDVWQQQVRIQKVRLNATFIMVGLIIMSNSYETTFDVGILS